MISQRFWAMPISDRAKRKIIDEFGGQRISIPVKQKRNDKSSMEKRDKKIVRLHGQGKRTGKIAKKFGLTKTWVRKILKRNGVSMMAEKKKERKKQIIELLSLGYSKVRIAKILGISRTRLYQIMKEEGL